MKQIALNLFPLRKLNLKFYLVLFFYFVFPAETSYTFSTFTERCYRYFLTRAITIDFSYSLTNHLVYVNMRLTEALMEIAPPHIHDPDIHMSKFLYSFQKQGA